MQFHGAEFFGTFWPVPGGCGRAGLAVAFPEAGIGVPGTAVCRFAGSDRS